MKKTLSLIILSAALAACTEDIPFTPGISFLTPDPEVTEETAIFRVMGQPFSSADSVKVPVIFGGEAERGIDYEASADHVTFTKDSPIDSIIITTRQLGTRRMLSLTLQIPEGFTAGRYAVSEFRLQDKYGLLTFDSEKGYIADTTQYTLFLQDGNGIAKTLSKDSPVTFAVNKEKSTAVEGIDFEFITPPSLMIAGGSSSAGFTIAPIGTAAKEGKDKIVLSAISDEKFDLGDIPEMELTIIDRELKALDGGWAADTLVTDSLYFKNIWGNQCTGYSLVPGLDGSEGFELSLDKAEFTPLFRSGFNNYFIKESSFTFGGRKEITDTRGDRKELLLLALDHTNRYFSETETSEDTLSYIGISLSKEEESGAYMMELYIVDHTSKSFMPELETRYGTEKPVATEPGTYIMANFRKSY